MGKDEVPQQLLLGELDLVCRSNEEGLFMDMQILFGVMKVL